MNSKQQILQRVRANRPPAVDLPALDGDGIMFEDLRQAFCQAIEGVGGQTIVAMNRQQADSLVRQLAVCQEASRTCSLAPDIGPSDSHVNLDDVETPRALADLDVTIAEGEFGVAENGAIWVSTRQLRHRAVLFLCQHLVLIIATSALVHNMHQAYTRLTDVSGTEGNPFSTSGFGIFISGPSKTADIEQSLVIGAQGPRSLTVVLIES